MAGPSKYQTRASTAWWLIGEPVSLKYWSETQCDDEGNAIPDVTGKKLPTILQALKHLAFLKLDNPKVSVIDLALETVDVIEVYWRMAKIPTQERTKGPKQKIYAGKRLANIWSEYLLIKKMKDRKTEAALNSRLKFHEKICKLFH